MAISQIGTAGLASGAARGNFGAGAVLQVVSVQLTPDFTTTSTTFVDVTGFQASITPSSASSKVLLIVSTSGYHLSTTQGEYRMLRNGVDPAGITSGRMWTSDGYYGSGTVNDVHMTFLDSPASTSAVTYKLQVLSRQGVSLTVGRDFSNAVAGLHTITMMEIAG